MHIHPALQKLFKLPIEVTLTNPVAGECPLCQSPLHLNALRGLSCMKDGLHFNIRVGNLIFLRPPGKTPFQVMINYRTHITKVGLYKGWDMQALVTIPEIAPLEELTEENLKTWVMMQ